MQKELWLWEKKRVARAVSTGLFSCWLPIPFQMVPAVLLAVYCRAYLPLTLICVWISNPLTWLLMAALAYELGYLILRPEIHYVKEIVEAESIWSVVSIAPQALAPFLVGAGTLSIVSAAAGYGLVIMLWDWVSKLHPVNTVPVQNTANTEEAAAEEKKPTPL